MKKFLSLLKRIGPGVITGASDNDPSAMTTFSIAGARFGFLFLWLPIFIFPVLFLFVYLFSMLGKETGKGFTDNLHDHYHGIIGWIVSILLLSANTFQVGANIGAIASILENISSVHFSLWAVVISTIIITLILKYSYDVLKNIFKWFTLVLLAYIASGILSKPDWSEVFFNTINPKIEWNIDFFSILLGIIGAALSPYLFFWQNSLIVEEKNKENHENIKHKVLLSDIFIGMLIAVIIMFFIILTAGNTLNKEGILNIESPQELADVLKPIGGEAAFIIFAIGFIGSAVFSIPALAISAAYSIAETKKWSKASLKHKPKEAPKFYLIIVAAIVTGIILNLAGIDPVDMLFIAAVINGIIILPIFFLLNHLCTKYLKIKRKGFRIALYLSWAVVTGIVIFLIYFLLKLIL